MQARVGKVLVNGGLLSPDTRDPFATKRIRMINLMDNERHIVRLLSQLTDIKLTARHNSESLTRSTTRHVSEVTLESQAPNELAHTQATLKFGINNT